jgi:GNAT superfamily N-acetyltransferase
MLQPLRQLDYYVVKQLFHNTFLCNEDSNFIKSWNHRHPTASIGYWIEDVLVGAAIVQAKTLEYIFIHPHFQNRGIGSLLLNTVLNNCSTIYLTAVKEPSVRAWYVKHGFVQTGEDTFVYG